MPPVRPARRVLIFVAVVLGLWLPPLLALRAADTGRAFSSLPLVDFHFSARPGVNLHPSELTAARLPETLANLDVLGIRWVRFTVPWDAVEPQRGRFNWEAWDAVMAALAERPDLQPVVVLDRSPSWARGEADADNPQAPPLERAYFGAFARALAERYGQQLRYYQVWHEPNIAPHWGAQAVDPAAYVGLLREAALHIRAVDAGAQVVLAALAPTIEAGGANLSDIAYLDGIYAAKGEPWFDVVAAQPYGFFAPPSEPATPERLNFARVTLLRDVLVRRGDAAKPLWASNWGWKAGPGEGSSWAGVDSAAQREFATQAFSTAQRQWPWLGPLFWPALCPDLPEADPLLGFALCEGDGPTPAGEAIAAAAQSAEILPPGHHRLDHPALVYGQGWRVAGGAADPPQTEIAAASGAGAAAPRAGPPLSFKFYGTGIALHVQGGEYWAYLTVTIDGRAANALPRNEEGAGYLVLHDPAAARRIVPLASGLPLGEHTVTLTPVGGWGQWPLQGVMVGDAAASPLPGPGLLAVFAALGTVVVALLVFSPRAGYDRPAVLAQDRRPCITSRRVARPGRKPTHGAAVVRDRTRGDRLLLLPVGCARSAPPGPAGSALRHRTPARRAADCRSTPVLATAEAAAGMGVRAIRAFRLGWPGGIWGAPASGTICTPLYPPLPPRFGVGLGCACSLRGRHALHGDRGRTGSGLARVAHCLPLWSRCLRVGARHSSVGWGRSPTRSFALAAQYCRGSAYRLCHCLTGRPLPARHRKRPGGCRRGYAGAGPVRLAEQSRPGPGSRRSAGPCAGFVRSSAQAPDLRRRCLQSSSWPALPLSARVRCSWVSPRGCWSSSSAARFASVGAGPWGCWRSQPYWRLLGWSCCSAPPLRRSVQFRGGHKLLPPQALARRAQHGARPSAAGRRPGQLPLRLPHALRAARPHGKN
jgi:polysaccharide biosynthesis protein PslG